jgi:hypothetical protein
MTPGAKRTLRGRWRCSSCRVLHAQVLTTGLPQNFRLGSLHHLASALILYFAGYLLTHATSVRNRGRCGIDLDFPGWRRVRQRTPGNIARAHGPICTAR